MMPFDERMFEEELCQLLERYEVSLGVWQGDMRVWHKDEEKWGMYIGEEIG